MTDTLTDEDRARLRAIVEERDDRTLLMLVTEYWHDLDRADRAPRWVLYFHLGLLSGLCLRLLGGEPSAPIGWGDTREKL
jgi:hypothetical protein